MSVISFEQTGLTGRLNYAHNLIEARDESGLDVNDIFDNVDESFWRFEEEAQQDMDFVSRVIGKSALSTRVLVEA